MLYQTILVPFDRSEHSQHALELAVRMIADDPEAEVVVFRSMAGTETVDPMLGRGVEGTGYVDSDTRDRFINMRAEQKLEVLEEIETAAWPIIEGIENPVSFLVDFYPTAVQGILAVAEKTGADAIVMGCRGVNAVAGMLGSVSYGVVRSADVPVTVVK